MNIFEKRKQIFESDFNHYNKAVGHMRTAKKLNDKANTHEKEGNKSLAEKTREAAEAHKDAEAAHRQAHMVTAGKHAHLYKNYTKEFRAEDAHTASKHAEEKTKQLNK